ncbi:MAG: Fic family protein [Bacteroidales bacterium]|nr:Fic family protein [Bacteroidales bacterium]
MYIYHQPDWPHWQWDNDIISPMLDEALRLQSALYGRLSTLGWEDRLKSTAQNIADDLMQSSEIEGLKLNADIVRSSVARRLGLDYKNTEGETHYIDGLVEVMMDATEHYSEPLTKDRLCAWQGAYFPTGRSGGIPIKVGQYRTNEEVVVSGFMGREKVHFRAPAPEQVDAEMETFLNWCNETDALSPIAKSAIAHLWFVTIHPFEDGNGRLARIIGDIFLSRSAANPFRFYNISTYINRDKRHYYAVMEQTQNGTMDITAWMAWYVNTLIKAIKGAQSIVSQVLNKAFFWQNAAGIPLSQRQVDTLNLFLDGYEAKITSKAWAAINKCSKDTAIRDIQDLLAKGLLLIDIPDAKRPSYSLCYTKEIEFLLKDCTEVSIQSNGESTILSGYYQGKRFEESISPLDAERYHHGDLPIQNILQKYCTYLLSL